MCPFRSEDKTKDAGYAQLCISKYLDEAKIRKPAMKRVIIATDGGRQHFKLFQNMHFMSEQHILRGLKLWWLFFQSYHGEAVTSPTVCCRFAMSCKEQCSVMRIRPIAGKGPADGGGNWLKSALALACLAGVSISNVYEVFMYALRNLVNNKTTSNFNEGRYYYYVLPLLVNPLERERVAHLVRLLRVRRALGHDHKRRAVGGAGKGGDVIALSLFTLT